MKFTFALLLCLALLGCSSSRAAPAETTATAAPTYADLALERIGPLVQAITAIAPLLQENRFDDAADLAAQMASAHDALVALDAPAVNAALHEQVVSASAQCRDAAATLSRGLEQSDQATVNTAVSAIVACANKLTPLIAELQAL